VVRSTSTGSFCRILAISKSIPKPGDPSHDGDQPPRHRADLDRQRLWHGTREGDESELRRVDPRKGKVLERLEMPPGVDVSGLESDGSDRFFSNGGSSGKVRAVAGPGDSPRQAAAPRPRSNLPGPTARAKSRTGPRGGKPPGLTIAWISRRQIALDNSGAAAPQGWGGTIEVSRISGRGSACRSRRPRGFAESLAGH
jgi:hypothetical protein